MVQERTYSNMLVCSNKIKKLINTHCKEEFIKRNSGYDGANVTENQILTDMIKKYLKVFTLEGFNDE